MFQSYFAHFINKGTSAPDYLQMLGASTKTVITCRAELMEVYFNHNNGAIRSSSKNAGGESAGGLIGSSLSCWCHLSSSSFRCFTTGLFFSRDGNVSGVGAEGFRSVMTKDQELFNSLSSAWKV